MNEPWPSFIAAQRNRCTLSSTRKEFGNAPLWTTGRCQRLLRPITSRTELLRKDYTRRTTAGTPDSINPSRIPEKVHNTITTKRPRDCKEEDGYWTRNKKRLRRTYAVRSKMSDTSSVDEIRRHRTASRRKDQGHKPKLQPGEFSVPTPILKRSNSRAMNPSLITMMDLKLTASPEINPIKTVRLHHGNRNGETHYDPAEGMSQIRNKTSEARFKVYEGIYNSLEVLLKAVTLNEEQLLLSVCDAKIGHVYRQSSPLKISGSKSLFTTCLRSIPTYMKEQEKSAAFEAEAMGKKTSFDTRIISAEIYADLESLGTSPVGWDHLRTVVQVHGVKVICDAIEDGLLDASIANVLAVLCVHMSVPDDAKNILASLLKSCAYPAPGSLHSCFRDDSTMLPLLALRKFFKHTGMASFYHCQMTNLLASGSLTITWLGTKQFTSIWTSLFHSLSTDPFDRDAVIFMTTVLPLLYRAQSLSFGKYECPSSHLPSMLSALDTTLASVLTTLLAMSKLSSAHMRSISDVMKSTIIDCKLVSSDVCCHAAALIVTANLLLSEEVGGDIAFKQDLVRYLGRKPKSFWDSPKPKDSIPSFICSVAHCYGRVSSKDGFEHLKAVLERLMAFESAEIPDGVYALQQIVVDSAFAFASHRPEARHLQYAKFVGMNAYRHFMKSTASPSICRIDPEVGFRWEEGINEWVMATPTFKLGGGKDLALSIDADSDSDSDCGSPIQLAHRRNKTTCPVIDTVHSGRISRLSELTPETPAKYCKDSFWLSGKYRLQDDSYQIQDLSLKLTGLRTRTSSKRIITKSSSSVRHNYQFWNHDDDDDDDELSSDQLQGILREQPNAMRDGMDVRRNKNLALQKPRHRWRDQLMEQSEDELGPNF